MKEEKLYYYINIMNFGGIDQRITLETSLYEIKEENCNKIIKDYMIRIKVEKELWELIYKLLYERNKND